MSYNIKKHIPKILVAVICIAILCVTVISFRFTNVKGENTSSGDNYDLKENVNTSADDEFTGGKEYKYSDEDLNVTVTLPKETAVPSDAVLSVKRITNDNNGEQYSELEKSAKEAVSGTLESAAYYDISFYTSDGSYIDVSDKAKVSFDYNDKVPINVTPDNTSSRVGVLHFTNGTSDAVDVKNLVTDNDKVNNNNNNNNNVISKTDDKGDKVTSLDFNTEGFSMYAVVNVTDYNSIESGPYVIVNTNRQGNNGTLYALTSSKSGSNRLYYSTNLSMSNGIVNTTSSITLWYFSKVDGVTNGYNIKAIDSGEYMSLSSRALTTSSSLNNSTTIYVRNNNTGTYPGQVMLSTSSNNNRQTYNINLYGGGDQGIFGSYNDNTGANEYLTLAKYADANFITYDFGLSAFRTQYHFPTGGSWYRKNGNTYIQDSSSEPTLSSSITSIADGETLSSVNGTKSDNGYYTWVRRSGDAQTATLASAGKSPGKDIRFDGWEATINGKRYVFPEGAEITKSGTNAVITDVNGNRVTVPTGTILKGKWTQISDVVRFFIGRNATILDTVGDTQKRANPLWTGQIAVGHIYYAQSDYIGSDTIMYSWANEAIRSSFAHSFDPNNLSTQIVIDYVTSQASKTAQENRYTPADGINATELDTSLLTYLYNREESINMAPGSTSNRPPVSSPKTSDNFSIRWYIVKDEGDDYHIDGVLVAKTKELSLSENFFGIDESQVNNIMTRGTNPLTTDVKINSNLSDYLSIKNSSTEDYDYLGKTDGSLSYRWVIPVINNEQYTFIEKESGTALSGYDVTTLITHYYTDDTGNNLSESKFGHETTSVDSTVNSTNNLRQHLLGGKSYSLVYDNFYTPVNTGSLLIKKYESDSDNNPVSSLSGAEFKLYGDNLPSAGGTLVSTVSSDNNGFVFFNNLQKNKDYYLVESTVPNGFENNSSYWKVTVDSNANVAIQQYDEYGNTVGDSKIVYEDTTVNGNTKKINHVYDILNHPDQNSVTLTASFSGITTSDLDEMVNKSKNDRESGYKITFQSKQKDEDDSQYKDSNTLYLADATRSADGRTFTWVIGLNSADKLKDWKGIQSNYISDKYSNTVVLVKEDGNSLNSNFDQSNNTVSFNAVLKEDNHDKISIVNTYTNTFNLRTKTVDTDNPETVLKGAVYDIYGSYEEATDSGKTVTYTDPKTGQSRTGYYIGSSTSDKDGIATYNNLTLSTSETEYPYILIERTAPDKFGNKIIKPEANYDSPDNQRVISVQRTTDGYSSGFYNMTIENKRTVFHLVDIDFDKKWEKMPNLATATFTLYRKTASEKMATALPYKITLDGNTDENTQTQVYTPKMKDGSDAPQATLTYSETAPWHATWYNLPVYSDTGEEYTYYIKEDNLNTHYPDYYQNLTDKIETMITFNTPEGKPESYIALPANNAYEPVKNLVIENKLKLPSVQLPFTGGIGDKGLMLLIIGVCAIAGGVTIFILKTRKKTRPDRYDDEYDDTDLM
ncbi:SpaA isopeptide-forming pilin-related protein [Howardella ureilytica]